MRGQRIEIASIRGRRGHARQQRDPHVRGPARDEILLPYPGFSRTQGHGIEDETMSRGHAGEQEMQARETIRCDEQSTLRTVMAGKRIDQRVEGGRDVLRTRERSLACIDQDPPTIDELLARTEGRFPLRIIRSCPAGGERSQGLADAPALVRKHADRMVEKIARAVASGAAVRDHCVCRAPVRDGSRRSRLLSPARSSCRVTRSARLAAMRMSLSTSSERINAGNGGPLAVTPARWSGLRSAAGPSMKRFTSRSWCCAAVCPNNSHTSMNAAALS